MLGLMYRLKVSHCRRTYSSLVSDNGENWH